MIKPTIGRQVWFWRYGAEPLDHNAQPEAATVVYVHADTLVNLQVLDHEGAARSETSVRLKQPEDSVWGPPYAEWMPYQVGQAAKTDQLEGR